jgi:hypothetical protein
MVKLFRDENWPNKSVQTEPVTCSFQARSGQEFAAEMGDGVKTMIIPAAQFLTLHSPVFQLPSTMSLQSTPVGHGPADLCR